jgi:hypothetical protein
MLWRSPDCILRKDRDLLLASLDKGLPKTLRTIRWSDEMARDRELVLKCFATHPELLGPYDSDSDDSGLPPSLLAEYCSNADAFRAFAFSGGAGEYRSTGYLRHPAGVHTRFDPALLEDPEIVADLVLHWSRPGGKKRWNDAAVKAAFPSDDVLPSEQPLLDNVDFALRLANGLLDIPLEHRSDCRVKYGALSPRLKKMPEVALAFVRVGGRNILDAPQALASNDEVWS